MSKNNPAWGKPNSPVGRVNRKEYFISTFCLLAYTALSLYVGIFAFAFGNMISIALGAFFVGSAGYLYWKYLMVCVQMWHDLNLSGWLCLINCVPSILSLLGVVTFFTHQLYLVLLLSYVDYYAKWGLSIISIILLFLPGTKGPNKYGSDPLEYEGKSSNVGLIIGIILLCLMVGCRIFMATNSGITKNMVISSYYANEIVWDITNGKFLKLDTEKQYPCGAIIKENENKTISVDFPDKCIPRVGEERYQVAVEDVITRIQRLVSRNSTFKCEKHKCILKSK